MRYISLTQPAINAALTASGLTEGGGVFAWLPEAERDKLPLLQSACRERGLRLMGGIFPALIQDAGFVREGAWLQMFAHMPPCRLVPLAGLSAIGATHRLVAEIQRVMPPDSTSADKPTLFLCFDAMLPYIATVLDGLYLAMANRFAYAGVNAGSETFQAMPCLFDSERLLGEGAFFALLPPALEPVLAHGFRQPDRAMTATTTDGNRIVMIDWQPAFSVYQSIIQAEYGITLTRENFYQYAVHFPFGIQRAGGDVVVRIPVGLSDDGALHCVGEIPENAVLVLLRAPALTDGDCVASLAAGMRAVHDWHPGGRILTFYCAGRRLHLGAEAEQELSALMTVTGAQGLAGALSLGEIGATTRHAYPMFHNAALLCAPGEAP